MCWDQSQKGINLIMWGLHFVCLCCLIRRECLKCLYESLLVFVPVSCLRLPFCWLSVLFFPLLAVAVSDNQLVKEIYCSLLGHVATFQSDYFIISTQIKYLAYAALPTS